VPLEDAFALWEDRERIPQWMPWITSVKASREAAAGRGGRGFLPLVIGCASRAHPRFDIVLALAKIYADQLRFLRANLILRKPLSPCRSSHRIRDSPAGLCPRSSLVGSGSSLGWR
jgi:hypothetical protein